MPFCPFHFSCMTHFSLRVRYICKPDDISRDLAGRFSAAACRATGVRSRRVESRTWPGFWQLCDRTLSRSIVLCTQGASALACTRAHLADPDKLALLPVAVSSRPTSPAPQSPRTSSHPSPSTVHSPAASSSGTPAFISADSSPFTDGDTPGASFSSSTTTAAQTPASSSRRRMKRAASSLGGSTAIPLLSAQDSHDSLPHYNEPDTPMIGSTGRHPRRAASPGLAPRVPVWKRPRFVGTCLFVTLVVLVLLPDGNRTRAHSALSNAGLQLPSELPERLQGLVDYLNWDDGSNDLRYEPPPPVEKEDFHLPDWDVKTPHHFDENGQLYVDPIASFGKNPPAPHPILTLIKRAETEWNAKVERQSKTLKEAVDEYRRRYKRNPPRGFDKWWEYARANRIVLTDEYDQIHHDLEPFWALCVPPSFELHRSFFVSLTSACLRRHRQGTKRRDAPSSRHARP